MTGIFEEIAVGICEALSSVGFHTRVEGSPDSGSTWATVNGDIPGGSVAIIVKSDEIFFLVFSRSCYQRKSQSFNAYDRPCRVKTFDIKEPTSIDRIVQEVVDLHNNKQLLRLSSIFAIGQALPFLGEPRDWRDN